MPSLNRRGLAAGAIAGLLVSGRGLAGSRRQIVPDALIVALDHELSTELLDVVVIIRARATGWTMAALVPFEYPERPQAAPHALAAMFPGDGGSDPARLVEILGRVAGFGRHEEDGVRRFAASFPAEGWRAMIGPRVSQPSAFVLGTQGFSSTMAPLHVSWLGAERLAYEITAARGEPAKSV